MKFFVVAWASRLQRSYCGEKVEALCILKTQIIKILEIIRNADISVNITGQATLIASYLSQVAVYLSVAIRST
jgi:hypothetical protein